MASFCPLQRGKFFSLTQSNVRATQTKGWARAWSKQFNLILKMREKDFFSSCTLIYNVIKCNKLDSNFDDHATRMKRRKSYCLMEHNSGFTRSHQTLPLGECPRHIAPVAAMVIVVGVRKNTTHN
jgi:hypothetical protein